MNQPNHTTFEYTYSAKQQEEVERIRKKYAPAPEAQDKMMLLRKLDAQTTQKATVISLVVGIVSTLILGLGMSCTMVWTDKMFIPGLLIGLIGIAGVIAAYPLYHRVVMKEREKISPQIMRLVEELAEKKQ